MENVDEDVIGKDISKDFFKILCMIEMYGRTVKVNI